MIGAILGDIIGSPWEYETKKDKDFLLFSGRNFMTDDSILTMAVFCALEKCNGNYANLSEFTAKEFIRFGKHYYDSDWGASFQNWLETSLNLRKIQPSYNSFGNGAAMRVSSVSYFASSLEECKKLSFKVTAITHNHPEGIKGAEATAVATYLALHGSSKEEIAKYIIDNYYQLTEGCNEIRTSYKFDSSCQGTVPPCIQAFLEAEDYEDAIRTTISLGGDADTMAAITGAIAEAYFGIPREIEAELKHYIDNYCADVIERMISKINKTN